MNSHQRTRLTASVVVFGAVHPVVAVVDALCEHGLLPQAVQVVKHHLGRVPEGGQVRRRWYEHAAAVAGGPARDDRVLLAFEQVADRTPATVHADLHRPRAATRPHAVLNNCGE